MTIYEFKARVSQADDAADIDKVCIAWLMAAMKDNGAEGKIGMEMLEIIKNRCMS